MTSLWIAGLVINNNTCLALFRIVIIIINTCAPAMPVKQVVCSGICISTQKLTNCLSEIDVTCYEYCKTLFFHRILISLFPYVENLLHFNFSDFPVNFIKQFVSYFFCCLK